MKKILVIDDHKNNLTSIKAVLKDTIPDCQILTALSGKEGIKIAQEEQPDTILLDDIMPRMDGYEVCKKLKEDELTKHIPVVMITAIKTDSESRIKGLNMGADTFISKPISPFELSTQVNVMLRIKKAEDKLRAEKEGLDEKVEERTKELKESEKQFRLIAENTSDIISITTFDLKAKYIYVSPSVKSLLDYEPEDMFGKSFFNFIHPEDKNVLFPLLKKYVSSKIKKSLTGKKLPISEIIEFRFKNKAGNWHFMQSTVNIVGKHLLAVTRDISERKKAELALAESEEKHKTIFNAANDAIFIMHDIKFETCNPKTLEMFACKQNEITGFTPIDFSPEFQSDGKLSAKKAQKMIDRTLAGEPQLFEWTHLRKDGTSFDAEVSLIKMQLSDKDYIQAIVRDISERKKFEQELKESKDKYKALYENAPLSYQSLNEDGCFKDINPTWLSTLGYKQEEVIGKYFKDFLHSDWKSHFEKNFPVFKKRGYAHDVHYKIRHKAGHYIDVMFEGCIGYHPDGNFKQTYCVFQDVTDRQLAVEALAEQSKKLSDILEGTNAGSWDWNILTGELILNERWAEIIGYTLEELKPIDINTWSDNVHPEDLPLANELLEKHFNNKSDYYDVEFRQAHKDGSWVWVNARGKVIERTTKGKPIRMSGTHLDITKRKRTQEELRTSEGKYRSLIETASEGFWLIDTKSKTIEVNQSLCEMLEYTRNEMIGKTPFEFVDEDNHKIFSSQIAKANVKRQRNYDISLRNKNGINIPTLFNATSVLDAKGNFAGSFAFVTNITDRKEAEELIKESEERFTLAMRASKDGLYDWNLTTNEIYYSENWKKILGYEDDELPNILSVWQNLTEHEGKEKSLKKMDWAIKNKIGRYEEEFKMRHKLGHWVDILSRPEFVYNEKGEAVRVVGTHVDITERKKYEQDLRNALKKAKESDRLKSAFLATMSHELRTPLNAIIGFSDIINDDLTIDEVVDFNKTINSSGRHLLSIVEDLFDITLIETGEIKIIKEDFLLKTALDELDEVINIEQQKINKEHISLRRIIPQDCQNITLHSDPSKLKQILINLLKNAMKFTNTGEIQYGCVIENIKDHSMLKFFVKDTGIGVPDEKQEFIFDIFRQVEDSHTRTYGGTGIGLSISKKLTEYLGGTIWLTSTEGKGSTFFFTIPYSNKAVSSKKHKRDTEFNISKEKPKLSKTILVVEDIKPSYEYLNVVLNKSGFKTIWAQNGKESIKMCKKNTAIDLVLMDINMPVMNGYEATKEIKNIKPNLPVIAQTAYAISGDREKALAEGCDDYISKPIKRDLLITLIQKHIEAKE